jgi:hypothetical protein
VILEIRSSHLPVCSRNSDLVQPDYALSIREVFTQFCEYLMKLYDCVYFLYNVGKPCQVEGPPSWVPDWSSDRICEQLTSPSGRLHQVLDASKSQAGVEYGVKLIALAGIVDLIQTIGSQFV